MKTFILFLIFSLSYAYNHENFKQINSKEQLNDFIHSSTLNVVVFVDKQSCNDDKCRQERTELEQIRDLCTGENIQFALSTNSELAEKQFNIYGSSPKLCFFRDGFPIIYSDSLSNVDSIHEWFGEVRQRLTHTLDDKTFEHDTQASTGSTTGDWFILFKKSNESHSLLPVWEATSLHFRNRAILAYVNIDTNPNIQKRFHIFNYPTFILFKRGKMYRYESTSWKQSAFTEFLESDYQKVKAEIIPPEPSAFSSSFGTAAKIIPMYLIVIPMICLVAVLLVLVFMSRFTKKKQTTTERTPFQVKID
ncbi:unnamed protein product [Adineta steineri]|uniref:Thioredoxin domain-containing protein n=1 Tax=Adineta steineri TaxID=433720 RepID=A0A814GVI4_9BILA|nr:unnamed protein product [Adineta steineri]CAF1303599.1 unnamed protein product [Adineta steineri]